MVLLAELLLAAGILGGLYRLLTRPGDRMSVVEPDRRPDPTGEGPLTADELVAMHIPFGVGYRRVDVDRLLDRLAAQLPRATTAPSADGDVGSDEGLGVDEGSHADPGIGSTGTGSFVAGAGCVSLTKEADGG